MSVHINAFAPTESAVMVGGAVNATQIPFVSFRMPPLQVDQAHQLSAPVLLCMWAENGTDHDPHFYVQVRDPSGQTRGNVELAWIWDDVPDAPCKWRVFDLQVPFLVFDQGVHTFGIYANPDDSADQALASYPFPITFDTSLPPLPPGQLPPGAEYK
ncbi:hypothetical protein [Mycobacterium sp. E802]|uniref:hypothetical protein n=1 Tax=Mycobacterium sp. E802 TaxID=1834152 RepID=UPI000AE92F93|nr:hypothetical protein [Mycobacterium sp. E802]